VTPEPARTGSVVDITGGPQPVSGSDSGVGSESGVVVDLTPSPVIPPDVGGGGAWEPDEEIDTPAEVVRVAGFDVGFAVESAVVVDLTPTSVSFADRNAPRRDRDRTSGTTAPARAARICAVASFESGRATEAARVLDLTPAFEDEQDFEELLASGALDMLLA
jgi:hypothetical protein